MHTSSYAEYTGFVSVVSRPKTTTDGRTDGRTEMLEAAEVRGRKGGCACGEKTQVLGDGADGGLDDTRNGGVVAAEPANVPVFFGAVTVP